MLVAFDTATPVASVALGEAGEAPLARRFLRTQRGHAASLVPAVRDLLDESGVSRDDLRGVVVGAGPGSFTGLRVGAATAKGLVRALGVPLHAISSLAAGAVTAGLSIPELTGTSDGTEPREVRPERPRHVLFDARGLRVYAATYRLGTDGLETLAPPRAERVDELLESGPDPEGAFCGSGARRHRERLEAAGFEVLPEPAGTPTADALLRLVALDPEARPVEDPARWEPQYLREWRPG